MFQTLVWFSDSLYHTLPKPPGNACIAWDALELPCWGWQRAVELEAGKMLQDALRKSTCTQTPIIFLSHHSNVDSIQCMRIAVRYFCCAYVKHVHLNNMVALMSAHCTIKIWNSDLYLVVSTVLAKLQVSCQDGW